ncbi:MAG: sulfatase [Candidatus Eisenbacteria sp.]|nr:sulfatase [Candidatus Eisenbacteria bacterium]
MGNTRRFRSGLWVLLALSAALAVCLVGSCGRTPRAPSKQLNLLLIMIDTLRADHLSCYGYERPTSPNIDALATQSTLFENAIAPSPWTLPSVASILTGLHSTRHQAIRERFPLPQHRETLAEVLTGQGYTAGAFVSGIFVTAQYGIDQGFADFDESFVGDHTHVSSPEITDAAVEWLRHQGDSPFVLFLHYFDPHDAYIAHPGFEFGKPYDGWVDPTIEPRVLSRQAARFDEEDRDYLISCYDSEIKFTDYHVGRVLDELKTLGLDESTVVVLTSDHGEEFLEHGLLGHRRTLYEEVLHVPLLLRHPDMRDLPERVVQPVGLVHLMPTLLDMLGVEWDAQETDARSFLDAVQGKADFDSLVFSERCTRSIQELMEEPRRPKGSRRNLRSLRTGPWKLIRRVDFDQSELYNLASDPGEQRDLRRTEAEGRAGRLEEILFRWMAQTEELASVENPEAPVTIRYNKETEARLRALGYLQ